MFRKLTKAGPASLATTLPANWVKKHNLKPGEQIEVEEVQDKLIISAGAKATPATIKIPYNPFLIDNMLEKLFWEQYSKIIITDENEIPNNVADKIKKFPGFEIIESTKNSITIERVLKPTTQNPESVIRRCYFLILDALEQNPPKFSNTLNELLFVAQLYEKESKELQRLVEFISTLQQINNRIYDDTFVRLKTTFQAIYEQKYRFQQTKSQELAEFFNKIDKIFEHYFEVSKTQLQTTKLYHAFILLKELNKEIVRKQSMEVLTSITEKKTKKKYAIGACLKNQSNRFWGIDVIEGMQSALANYKDAELIIKYPLTDFDINEQEEILEEFVSKGVDIIIYAPIDPQKLEKTLKKINKAKIPLVILDTDLELKDITYKYIGFDNYQGGKITAEYLSKHIKKKSNIVVLEGHLKGNFSERVEGFLSVFGKENNTAITGEFIGSVAYETIKEHAKKHKITAVFATSDNMALGAIQALEELNIKIPICGFDATKEGIAALEKGKLFSTVNTNPHRLGELAVQTAQDILTGRTVADRTEYAIELITKQKKE